MRKKILSLLLAALIFMSVVTVPEKTQAAGAYCWPVRGDGTVITQDYHSDHTAIDIVSGSQRILATKAGTVIAVYSGCNNAGNYGKWSCQNRGICSPNHGYSSGYCNWGYGRGVILKHADGSGYSQYAHMSSVSVSQGQYVQWGQELGVMGNYGMSTGTHLHFSLTRSVSTENPNYYINFTSPINPYDVDYSFTNNSGVSYTGSPVYFDGFTTNGAGKSFYVSGANALLVCNIKSANNAFPLNRPQYGNRVSIVKYIGVELYKDGVLVAQKGEVPIVGTDIIQVWYDVNSELGHYLSDGYYSYRFYASVGTQKYYSEMKYFTVGNPVQKLKITFDPNGGTCSVASKEVVYGGTYGELPVPTRTGYTFSGWTNLYNVVNASSKVELDHDHTLYATWEHTGALVTFDAGGGSVDVKTKVVPFDGVYGELPVPVREGYTFVGWFNDDEKMVTAESKIYSNEDHMLYADWNANEYTVTFDGLSPLQEPEVEFTEKKVKFGDMYGTLPKAYKKGSEFTGWYDKTHDGNLITEKSFVDIPKDHTLYAGWKTIWYKLYFDANGGEVSKAYKDICYRGVYGINGILPTPTKEGYTFLGWFEEKDGGLRIHDMMGYYGESDKTVYAVWVKEESVAENLEIVSFPDRMSYEYEEKFDPTGLEVKITYSDGTVLQTTNAFEISDVNTKVPEGGNVMVTVKSGEASAKFGISVGSKPEVVKAVEISTLPTKLVYKQGESFDGTGLVLKVTLEDGQTKLVSEGYTVKGFDSSEAGVQTLTVEYGGYSDRFAVTVEKDDVTEKPEPEPDEEYMLGDVTGDGKVNALDATQILRYANNKSSVLTTMDDNEKYGRADVTGDKKINALDATQILRYANNKSSVLSK
ncbi:MAG: InlB B-repeat-containing protein [Eubacteriaceae bacterium]|nr:InlB B-repeat-containing protein [Eubacteriaceae bacterium]